METIRPTVPMIFFSPASVAALRAAEDLTIPMIPSTKAAKLIMITAIAPPTAALESLLVALLITL